MASLEIAGVRLEVEHRNVGADGGGTLRVLDSEGRERLRFDCFERLPHFHLDPGGRDEVTALDPLGDPIAWTIGELERDLEGYLGRAGFALEDRVDRGKLAPILGAAEQALRCPIPDLDAIEPAALRQRRGEKWRLYGPEVLPAWVADMDFPVAAPIQRAFRDLVRRSDFGYPRNPSVDGLPTLFAERMAERFGWQVEPRLVEVIIDVVQGIFLALHTYAEIGEGAVVQTPIYPPFLGALQQTQRALVESPLALGPAGYEVDLDHLRSVGDARTRLLLLCNPHNPSGRVFTRAELEGIAQVALEQGWIVIADEIHADLVYEGRRHIPFASLSPEIAARTVTLTSATKAFNVAGMRCAVAAFGSRELKARFNALGGRHAHGGASTAGMLAMETAWRHCQPWLDHVVGYLEANRDFVARFAAENLEGIVTHVPEATYLAWLDCRALELPEGPHSFFLHRARVGLNDGATFGTPGDGYVRLNFATSRAILRELLERMAASLKER
ncbi:MAG: MalY/PatB family protein [Myxococcota bacterium]